MRTNNEETIAAIQAAVDPESSWQDQIRHAVEAYVDTIKSRPAIALSWIRELPALGPEVRPVQRQGMERMTTMLMDLSASPGFRRAQLPPLTHPLAVVLFGGLRELTALTVEDGVDPADIVEPAVTASMALLGPQAV